MNPGAHDPTALANSPQRQGNKITDRRKDYCSIERLWRHLFRAARPGRAERPGERLGGHIAWPGKGKYASSLVSRHLRQNMSCGAEAVEANFLPAARNCERPPADQPGAEQRGEGHVAPGFVKREGEAGIGNRRRRETAIARISRENWIVA